MYVTATKQMTTDEIRAASLTELKTIYRQRLEDWVVKPMEALAQVPDAGWALVQLLRLIPYPHLFAPEFDTVLRGELLSNENVFLSGDIEGVCNIKHFSTRLTINPHRLPGWIRANILEAAWLLTDVQAEDFRHFLVVKSMIWEAE